MDRTAAMKELPDVYGRALRLRDEGVNAEEIAARLNIEPEAVQPLMRIAAAKLDGILMRQERMGQAGPPSSGAAGRKN
jgi:DNA-directed RNA polymerase specialized sigma24 family protein